MTNQSYSTLQVKNWNIFTPREITVLVWQKYLTNYQIKNIVHFTRWVHISFQYYNKYYYNYRYYYYYHFTALWILSGTTRMRQYQKKHSPTHIYHGHHSIIPYLLPPSISIHGILPVQFTCLTVFSHNLCQVFFGLPLGLAPSTSYCIHFFTQSPSSFCSTCPYYRNLLCCRTEIMSSNPSLSLNPLLRTLSFSIMPHYTVKRVHQLVQSPGTCLEY